MLPLVVGCAIQRPYVQPALGEKILQGRFVLEFTQNMRRQREQGKFLWVHSARQTKLEIFSPFGQTQARLEIHTEEGAGVQSVLYTQGQTPRYADNPETLIQQLLGFSLPVQAFTVWIDGQPAGAESVRIIRDQQGRITSIQQMDWVIDYQPYAAAIPRQISLRHTAKDLLLRLIIDN